MALPAATARRIGWGEAPQGELVYWVAIERGAVSELHIALAVVPQLAAVRRASFRGDVLTDFGFIEHSFGLTAAEATRCSSGSCAACARGVVTTAYPRGPGPADGFARGRIDVPRADGAGGGLAALCPTGAIAVHEGRVALDRGRCILCGLCVEAEPGTVRVRARRRDRGSHAAHALVVGRDATARRRLCRPALAEHVRALRRSIHIRHVDAGSDGSEEWEIQALTNPYYDMQRLGLFFTASPRHADILLVTGGVSRADARARSCARGRRCRSRRPSSPPVPRRAPVRSVAGAAAWTPCCRSTSTCRARRRPRSRCCTACCSRSACLRGEAGGMSAVWTAALAAHGCRRCAARRRARGRVHSRPPLAASACRRGRRRRRPRVGERARLARSWLGFGQAALRVDGLGGHLPRPGRAHGGRRSACATWSGRRRGVVTALHGARRARRRGDRHRRRPGVRVPARVGGARRSRSTSSRAPTASRPGTLAAGYLAGAPEQALGGGAPGRLRPPLRPHRQLRASRVWQLTSRQVGSTARNVAFVAARRRVRARRSGCCPSRRPCRSATRRRRARRRRRCRSRWRRASTGSGGWSS